MTRRRADLYPAVVVSTAILVGACTPTSTTNSPGDGGATEDASAPPSSFDPRPYSKACTTKGDCQLAPIINDCRTCCGQVPVNATDVHADLEAVTEACAGRARNCSLACEPAHAECVDQQCIACSERACSGGVLIQTPVTGVGTNVFEATIDGTTIQCTLDRPNGASGATTSTCSPGISLILNGDTPITVLLETTTAKTITFRATHDGSLVGEKTFAPIYGSEPGPNGPQCEPKECLVAHVTFP